MKADELPETNRLIVSLLAKGKENARTVAYLSNATGFSSTRVREIVSETVTKYGIGIGTSNTIGNSGYYLISNDKEREETLRNLRSRARKILKRSIAISKIPPNGQGDMFAR
jgi:hypothetical protein